jgi:NAD(P)-dependent dehydrogenase (short-subunit alcohol dehydrogenase family)
MTWTLDNIPDQTNRVTIVTGANSGLGYETSLALAQKNATVVMACRNMSKGEDAKKSVLEHVPDAKVDLRELDLSSLASVRAFAEGVKRDYERLDILMNNAGLMALPRRETADGFEMQFGVNHLGHFALTGLLLDMLLATENSRVVNVSSGAHKMYPQINFADVMGEKEYKRWDAYGQSKFANILFTHELQRRFETAGAASIAVAAHPGLSTTNLQPTTAQEGNVSWFEQKFLTLLTPLLGQSPASGALPQLRAATAPDVQGSQYYGPKWFGVRGAPVLEEPHKNTHDTDMASKLWEMSQELTGVDYQALG